jgi:hypothetical protein
MAKKPPRPRFTHTREFVDEDGTPTYIERRGLQEFKTPLPKQARSKLSPRAQKVARRLSIAASEILKRVGEKTLNEVLESVKPTTPNDEDAATKAAVVTWGSDITKRHGIISLVTHAADFLCGLYLIPLSFAARPADKQADEALADITRHILQVYAFCDAWHWLHMEVYGEHRRALDGVQSAENLGAAAPARAEKKKERMEIVRRACAVYWTKHGRRNAAHTAERLYSEVHKTLKTKGHQTYTRESFVKVVREIFRESASQS